MIDPDNAQTIVDSVVVFAIVSVVVYIAFTVCMAIISL